VDAIVDNLVRRKAARPRTLKTLRGTIAALFVKQRSYDEIDRLVAHLTRRDLLAVADGKVHYQLPS
jgi:hypothetical protein